MKTLFVLLSLVSVTVLADDFSTATVLDVQSARGLQASAVFGDVQSDDRIVITLQMPDFKVTAQTYSAGGGAFYLQKHPEAMIVGSSVEARLKKNLLEVRVPDGKVIKLDVQRLEKP